MNSVLKNRLRELKISSTYGETLSNMLSGIYYFSKGYWDKLFLGNGCKVFYVGCFLMDYRILIERRKKLSIYIGSTCYYIFEKDGK